MFLTQKKFEIGFWVLATAVCLGFIFAAFNSPQERINRAWEDKDVKALHAFVFKKENWKKSDRQRAYNYLWLSLKAHENRDGFFSDAELAYIRDNGLYTELNWHGFNLLLKRRNEEARRSAGLDLFERALPRIKKFEPFDGEPPKTNEGADLVIVHVWEGPQGFTLYPPYGWVEDRMTGVPAFERKTASEIDETLAALKHYVVVVHRIEAEFAVNLALDGNPIGFACGAAYRHDVQAYFFDSKSRSIRWSSPSLKGPPPPKGKPTSRIASGKKDCSYLGDPPADLSTVVKGLR